MGMTDDPIYVITDQPPGTSVGSYADSVYRLLRTSFPGLRVVYAGCSALAEREGWHPLSGAVMAKGPWGIAPALRRNYRRLCAALPRASAVHFCGVWYAPLRRFPRSIAFVHDFYPRRIQWSTLAQPRRFLRDASTVWQYLVLPRHVRGARLRLVPTYHVQRQLNARASLSSRVVHHWAEPERFRPRDRDAARRELGLPRDGRLVLNVSDATSNKGYGTLASIATRLPSDYRFVKVGGSLPPSPRIVRMARLSDAQYPLLFNACDAYVHASTEEGFGYPLIEAMGSGLPVVALKTEVSAEVLGEGGLWVPPRSSGAEWVSTIRSLESEEVRAGLLARARDQLTKFRPELARAAMTAIYRETFGPTGGYGGVGA